MKIDRLLSIVILLMNRKRIQAKELADLFEVSVRTIYRDIDVIDHAGIPVMTYPGAGGGIGLVEGYRLDRNLLTHNDLAAIVTALRSISTSYSSHENQMLLEKINSIIPASKSDDFEFKTKQFIVDFSSWGDQGLMEEKLNKLKQAIEQLQVVAFTYCNADGDVTERSVEPYTLVLKKQRWYLYAYCRQREQFRLFKLFRMKDVVIHELYFVRQPISMEDMPWAKSWQPPEQGTPLQLRFHAKVRHLAEEWFGVESLLEDGEGRYTVSVAFPEDNWLYGFILSFGEGVEVLEPAHIREKIKKIAEGIVNKYERTC
ncbi:helix-turn-helix transcriptional regulator [Paenibacillus eucommiae]|uniref:DNA-binding transcriptional regulator YafY n=1 Tax=Paenibacillus eucommiae TaxID=1355755 RepID=A0ABS4IU41_9BACL|nr:YafY family protein [Paenibacillus eucommiae]MBP1991102.1 putative DNA-binding transcriptional regulator YafY [Paenibacillus eucommiae]